jgi:hypothetical protein
VAGGGEVNSAKAYVTNYEIPLEFLMGITLVYYSIFIMY